MRGGDAEGKKSDVYEVYQLVSNKFSPNLTLAGPASPPPDLTLMTLLLTLWRPEHDWQHRLRPRCRFWTLL